jgi:hypothetical protein
MAAAAAQDTSARIEHIGLIKRQHCVSPTLAKH